jgi:predicted  nucleic acid-binding Zn-ribbon protein
VESQAEKLIVLQDLLELRRETSDDEQQAKLEEMGFPIADRAAVLRDLDAAIAGLRRELAPGLLRRFERVSAKYRRPLAPVRNGTCYGCFVRIPTGRMNAPGPDGIQACPNCGRLIYPI